MIPKREEFKKVFRGHTVHAVMTGQPGDYNVELLAGGDGLLIGKVHSTASTPKEAAAVAFRHLPVFAWEFKP